MENKKLKFNTIKKLITYWKNISNNKHIEIAALEPTLWKDNNFNIVDLVRYLKEEGFVVSMTTNGSLLYKYAKDLKEAQIDLVRVSWHSMNYQTYKVITGGGDLDLLLKGLDEAIKNQLPLSINRVLMKGFLDDLEEQISYIDKHKLRLKLLDLYWTEDSKEDYEKYYISPDESLTTVKDKLNVVESNHTHGRDRIRYNTKNGGIVEYKISSSASRSSICDKCPLSNNCLEGFGDYLRVFPNGEVSLCYLRTDLAVNVVSEDNEISFPKEFKKEYLDKYLDNIPLRLVLEGRCNFNCGFPTSKKSWCLKQGRGFIFPKRKEIMVVNYE